MVDGHYIWLNEYNDNMILRITIRKSGNHIKLKFISGICVTCFRPLYLKMDVKVDKTQLHP